MRWRAVNLHYPVAEEGVAKAHELPHGWGLLVREEEALRVAVEPTWQDATEEARMGIFLRIALAGTWEINHSLGVELPTKSRRWPDDAGNSGHRSPISRDGRNLR